MTAWQRATDYWLSRQSKYGPPGTTDSPQYNAFGKPTGRTAGAEARTAERKEKEANRRKR